MEVMNDPRFKEKCRCEAGVSYEQLKDCIGSTSMTLALARDIEGVKGGYRDRWTKDDAVQFLTQTVFDDSTKYRPLYAFALKKVKEDNRDAPRRELDRFSDISRTVADILGEWTVAPPVQTQAQAPATSITIPGKENGPDTWPLLLVWLASVVTSAAIMFLLMRRWAGGAHGGGVSHEVKDYVNRKIERLQQRDWEVPSNKQGQRSSSKNHDQAGDRVKKLEQEVATLRKQIESTALPNGSSRPPMPEYQPEPPTPRVEFLFLPGPDDNGDFNEGDASQVYREGSSIYKFTKQSSDRASFAIHDHPSAIKMAIAYPDRIIKPVCDTTGATQNAKRIVTETTGEARLEGGRWRTTRKARIRYDY
jgi:hypothetical protein